MKKKKIITIGSLLICLIAIFIMAVCFIYPYISLKNEIEAIMHGTGSYEISCYTKKKEEDEFSAVMSVSGEKYGEILNGNIKIESSDFSEIGFYYDAGNNDLLFSVESLIEPKIKWLEDNVSLVNEILSGFKDVYISLEQLQSIQGGSESTNMLADHIDIERILLLLKQQDNIDCRRVREIENLTNCEQYHCFEIKTNEEDNIWIAMPKEQMEMICMEIIIVEDGTVTRFSVSFTEDSSVHLEMPDNQLSEKQVELLSLIYVLYQKVSQQV